MKKAHLITVIIAVIGVIVAFFLKPAGEEEALINFKGKRYSYALNALKSELEGGQMSASAANTLRSLYLQEGDVKAAAEVIEQFVTGHPEDIWARRELGKLYQYAERPEDYRRNLEEIVKLQPEAKDWKELSDIYNFTGEYDKQITALQELIKLQPDEPKPYVDLARIQASQKKLKDAVETMKGWEQALAKKSEKPDLAALEFYVSILMDTGEIQHAREFAKEWLSKEQDIDTAVYLARAFRTRGEAEAAKTILESHVNEISGHEGLFVEWVEVELARGDEDGAYKLLTQALATDMLPNSLKPRMLELSIRRQDEENFNKLMAVTDLATLPEDALISLGIWLNENRNDKRAEEIRGHLGKEYLTQHPVVDAAFALAAKDKTAEAKLQAMAKGEKLPSVWRVKLARAALQAGYKQAGLNLFAGLQSVEGVADSEVNDIASLYLDLGRAKEGEAVFARLKEQRATVAAVEAWARLAVATGKSGEVLAWLNKQPDSNLGTRLLTDLYFLGLNNRAHGLALVAAQKLVSSEPTSDHHLYLSYALFKNGKGKDGVAELDQVDEVSPQLDSIYLGALREAAGYDQRYMEKLEQRMLARLGDPRASDAALLDTMRWMVEKGKTERAMQYIEPRAMQVGGEWGALYERALIQTKNEKALLAYWQKRMTRGGLSIEERRRIGYGMLERGHKQEAEALFKQLADQEGPEGKDVAQLFYLWGPRPSSDKLAWISRRAATSQGKERELWSKHLVALGGDSYMSHYAGDPKKLAEADDAVFAAAAASLSREGEHEKIAQAAVLRAEKEQRPQNLLDLANLIIANGKPLMAEKVVDKLLRLEPNNPKGLKLAGMLGFTRAHYKTAKSQLAAYLQTNPEDAEANYYYGEMLYRDKLEKESVPFFQRAQANLDGAKLGDRKERELRAHILYRLGQRSEALEIMEALVKDYSGDDHLRADYAVLLLDSRKYGTAEQVLQPTEATP